METKQLNGNLKIRAFICSRQYIQCDAIRSEQFCGDVVSEKFNKTFRDGHNNLDQIYISKYIRIIFVMIFILFNIIRKLHTTTTVALKPNLWVPYCYVLYFYKYAFSLITFKIQNLYNNDPKIFAFHTFVLKHPYAMLKLFKTTSLQNPFPSDCITLYNRLIE